MTRALLVVAVAGALVACGIKGAPRPERRPVPSPAETSDPARDISRGPFPPSYGPADAGFSTP